VMDSLVPKPVSQTETSAAVPAATELDESVTPAVVDSPSAPGCPGAPVEPLEPLEPLDPSEPSEPSEPAAPRAPAGPCGPAAPSEPAAPAAPALPCVPSVPASPAQAASRSDIRVTMRIRAIRLAVKKRFIEPPFRYIASTCRNGCGCDEQTTIDCAEKSGVIIESGFKDCQGLSVHHLGYLSDGLSPRARWILPNPLPPVRLRARNRVLPGCQNVRTTDAVIVQPGVGAGARVERISAVENDPAACRCGHA
jgi:hypothetical protein